MSLSRGVVGLTRHRGGSGPPLVLLHGLGLSWRSWLPVIDALQERHAVFALDLPGFGHSEPLPRTQPPTPGRLAAAVQDEFDRLGLGAPAVVGQSLGGWVALELARSGRASAAVAIAPSGLESPPERAWVIAMNEMLRVRAHLAKPLGHLAARPLPARVALFGGLRSRPWRLTVTEGLQELEDFSGARSFHATLVASVGVNMPTRLQEIRVPVRIAYGTADLLLGAVTAPRFAASIPTAELVPLPGLGHVPMRDDPGLVARTILEFTQPA